MVGILKSDEINYGWGGVKFSRRVVEFGMLKPVHYAVNCPIEILNVRCARTPHLQRNPDEDSSIIFCQILESSVLNLFCSIDFMALEDPVGATPAQFGSPFGSG